jgi:hypothetical protein
VNRRELQELQRELDAPRVSTAPRTITRGRWLDLAMYSLGKAKFYRKQGDRRLVAQCLKSAAAYRRNMIGAPHG